MDSFSKAYCQTTSSTYSFYVQKGALQSTRDDLKPVSIQFKSWQATSLSWLTVSCKERFKEENRIVGLVSLKHTAKLQVLHTAFMYRKELYSLQVSIQFKSWQATSLSWLTVSCKERFKEENRIVGLVSLQLLLLAQHTAKLEVLHTAFMYRKELYSLQGAASIDVEQFKLSVIYSPGFTLHTSD
ncbi:hypothetical protein POTOM_041407 [Populus tomentosa]|uniref:Uncharacterized protein n=1 Tax=Populus tomentosa TaxID=118781 RepID=A0A8X8CJ43_POPTO|nr:hypothetical protein POTOM_041407 [Populus tomentosa]